MVAKLRPNRVRRTYLGGGRIDAFTGYLPSDDGELRPEDWLASTTTAFNGTHEIKGEGLGQLDDGRRVKDVVGPLPILVKLLDSDERLVIQAHPTVPFAKKYLNSPVGKTECWYFLPGTDPNACVYLGFKPGVTRESWSAAIRANWGTVPISAGTVPCDQLGTDPNDNSHTDSNLTDYLNKIKVSAGDLVFVEGGLPHAIGAGCFMIELQEPSDLMVVAERWTPSGREIPEGKRFGGLDWEKMLDVYAYDLTKSDEIKNRFVRYNSLKQQDELLNQSVNSGSVPRIVGSVPGVRSVNSGPVPGIVGSVPRVRCVVGPDLTDKFEMWEMGSVRREASTEELRLAGVGAVVVVTEGTGTLNGLTVRKGDRLVVKDEPVLTLTGAARAVVCRGGTRRF